MKRRTFLLSMGAAAVSPTTIVRAAEAWPTRPVTIVVPFGAGGSADLVARICAQGLQVKYGQSFIIENRGGAGGIIGTAVVAKSPNDGYTLLIGTASTLAINPSIYAHLPYDWEKAFAPISPLVSFPNLLVANPKLPVSNVAEFIAYLKQHDGKLNYGSSGNGTSSHLCALMLMRAVGVSMTHVPFRGFPEEMTALVGGELDFVFDSITTEWPFAKSGQVRPLAVSSAKRTAIAPEIPAIGESIAGFDASAWQAICAPAGTPEPLLLSLAQDVRQIFTSPDVVALLQNVGGEPLPMQPDEFARFIVRERAKWAEVVNACVSTDVASQTTASVGANLSVGNRSTMSHDILDASQRARWMMATSVTDGRKSHAKKVSPGVRHFLHPSRRSLAYAGVLDRPHLSRYRHL